MNWELKSRSKTNIYSSLLIWLFLFFPAFPQTDVIQFSNIGINQGLSNSTVYCIIQDKLGFMWFGTQSGLNKFDGYNFTVYKNVPFDSTSLSDNWIQALLEDSQGNIWIGSHSGGVFKFDRNKEIFYNYKHDPSDKGSVSADRIWSLFQDKSGYIWIGTSSGLDRYDPETNKFKHYIGDDIKSLINNAVNSIYQDKNNFLWVGTWGSGLYKLNPDGSVIQRYTFDDHPVNPTASNKIKVVFEDSDGILWLGTNQDGLIRFDKSTGHYQYFINDPKDPNSISYNSILSIIEDRRGNIWIGTHNGGVNRLDRKTNKFYSFKHNLHDPYSLSNDWVPALFEDKAGTIWIGSDRGVDKYLPEKLVFRNITHIDKEPNSLSSEDVHALLSDSEGILWAGTWRGGLNSYNPVTGKYKHYYNNPNDKSSLPHDIVLYVYEDKADNLWIGTYNGLAKFNRATEKFKVYIRNTNDPQSIGFNNISAICEDSFDNLWVGTWGGGLYKMNLKTEKFTQYIKTGKDQNEISDMIITYIYEDSKKNLYIGTAAGGVNIYSRDKDNFITLKSNVKNRNSISNNSISSIVEDLNGNIWIGTLGGGLNKFKIEKNEFTHFTTDEGLPENVIVSLQMDAGGILWMSTTKNICRFNPNTEQINYYEFNDGIGNTEFISASTKGKDGKLYFGGKNGVTYFYPSISNLNQFIPPVRILSFNIFDQPVKLNKDISTLTNLDINYSDNAFSIEFGALGYPKPDKIKYAFKLEGFDKDWIYLKDRRTAYYTNLDPGHYEFRMKASTDNIDWFESASVLKIYIAPPFWQTWWFILLSIALISALVFAAYRYRLQQLLKVERLRTSIAADLHDEIASNLSSIAMFGKIIQDESCKNNPGNESANQLLNRIISLSQESVTAIREIIWAIDPKTETIYDLLIKLRDMIISTCRAKNINLNFDFPDKNMLPAKNLSPQQRRDLWMLLKEAMHNSVKHSNCGELSVISVYDDKTLRIVVSDNGKGFKSEFTFAGKGLSTMKKRAENLGAKFEIKSVPQEGTSIILMIDI